MESLAEAIRTWRRRGAERMDADLKVRQLTAAKDHAAVQDRATTAAALRDRKPDPGPQQVQAVERDLAQARNEAAARADLLADAEDAVVSAVAALALANQAAVDHMAEHARTAIAGNTEALRGAVALLVEAHALGAFLRAAMEAGPKPVRMRRLDLPVTGLRRANGDAYLASQVVDAMADLAEVPVEPEPRDAKPLGQRPPDDAAWVSPNG
jgi:hypothetical protein